MMKINIHAVQFHADRKLNDYITKKAEKLLQYFSDLKSCDVFLKLASPGKPENKIVEIKLHAPGKEFFAKEQCSTFEEAFDLASSALQKQLIKFKEKIRRGM